MSDQYLRKAGLIVTSGSSALDLSQMRIRFRVSAMDVDAPPTAVIRVFNLSDATARQIQKEFQEVQLQAGYEGGNFGRIFKGTIVRVRRGKLDATTKFVDIMAADGDLAYNFGFVSKTLAAGSSITDQINAAVSDMKSKGISGTTLPSGLGSTGGVLPRGKVLFGLARERLTDAAGTSGTSWRIQDGQVVFTSLTSYDQGQVPVLNARTGMIGVPEATNNGIEVKCLLNPNMRVGGRVQIDNRSINTTTVRTAQGFPRYSDIDFFASTSDDGFYRVLVVEHEGDTRGDEWQTELTCLSVDNSAGQNPVQAYG